MRSKALMVLLLAGLVGCGAHVSGRVTVPTEGSTPEDPTVAYICEFSGWYWGVSRGSFSCPIQEGETGGVIEGGAEGPSEIARGIWEAGFGMVSTLVQGALALVGQQLPLPNAGGE